MKKLISLVAALFLLFSLSGCSEAEAGYPKPTDKFFVNDFANVIDDSAETEFYAKAAALDKKTTAQVVLVTVQNLNGKEPSQYALELGREWGVGSKESNNGIVVLLATEDREIYISVGYGLEGALPDSKTGRIIDVYGLEKLKENDFSDGIIAIGNALINEVYIEYGLPPEQDYVNINNVSSSEEESPWKVIISWIIMIIILLVLSLFSRRRGGGGFFFFPGYFGGFHSGRGSFGGGGGFGGFKGGGGSFGGGGAGRGF